MQTQISASPQTAAPQPIRNPALPPDTHIDLVSMSSAGQAETAFDLTRLVPSSANVKLKVQLKMRIRLPKQAPQDADTTTEMSMSLTGR